MTHGEWTALIAGFLGGWLAGPLLVLGPKSWLKLWTVKGRWDLAGRLQRGLDRL
jgi:hypothetical protein